MTDLTALASSKEVDTSQRDNLHVCSTASNHCHDSTCNGAVPEREAGVRTPSLVTPECCLWAVLIINTSICVAQFVAAHFSGSLSLLADGVHIAVDSITIAVNIYAERARKRGAREGRSERHIELIQSCAGLFSGLMIIGAVLWLTVTAIRRLMETNAEDNVDVGIMTVFAGVGLVGDIVCVVLFYSIRDSIVGGHHGHSHSFSQGHAHSHGRTQSQTDSSNQDQSDINLCSAALHTGTDLLRSVSVLTIAAIAWASDSNGTVLDAVCSLVLGVLIGGAASWIVVKASGLLLALFHSRNDGLLAAAASRKAPASAADLEQVL